MTKERLQRLRYVDGELPILLKVDQDFGQVLSLGLFVKLPDGVGANLGGKGQQVKKLKSSPVR